MWVTTARPNPLEARAGPLAELRGSWFPFHAGALGIWEPQLLLLVLSYGECQSTACRWLWCSCGEEEEDASPRLGAGTSPAVTHTALGAGVELKPANQLFFFFFLALHIWFISKLCRAAVEQLPAPRELVLQEAGCVWPWEGAAMGKRGRLLSPPCPTRPCSPGIRFAVVLPGHDVLKQLPAGDPARGQGGHSGHAEGLGRFTACSALANPPQSAAVRAQGERGRGAWHGLE